VPIRAPAGQVRVGIVTHEHQERGERGLRLLPYVGRGFLMGGADIIPGVSGGTVALILGIYRRLVTAISHFDLETLRLLGRRQFAKAIERVDLYFLAALGTGIVSGIVLLAGLMHSLLTNASSRPYTLAVFFGMILASSVIVARMVERWNIGALLICAFGAAVAFLITGLPVANAAPTYPYVFFCGAVAICAMILPGISGAYILLLLGMYLHVTGAIKGIPKGDLSVENLTTIAVFMAGCALGLVTFSKILRWLLARHESITLALLGGFMLGSLRKIWPFQRDLTPHVEKLKLKQFANVWPDPIDGTVLMTFGLMLFAALLVLGLNHLGNRGASSPAGGSR
jgi:putative membrane protein